MNEPRALLLTDVVDSTQLAERLGDAAAAELNAAHDRVARDLLRTWRGREIDKTDGMLMLFDSVADAAGCAAAYHAALAALPLPLRARAGLHFGPVILRSNPPEDVARGAKPLEVEGIAKPLAARVMSLALGGQTLLTAEARAALGDTALSVVSHGFWRIKGLSEPVELFEAGAEGAPFMPPPDAAKVYRVVQRDGLWLPLREVPNNLPAERDAFVGRLDALLDLARRFEAGARLVSLIGIGGTGKTRLALRFARTWLGDYPGGVWFCDLSQARDADGLVLAAAHGLGVPLGKEDAVMQLGHAIGGRGRCLVILDNFEQVTRHAEDTLGRWLDRESEARFLVTTREVLGLSGEQAMALAPLPAAEASALFVQRAMSARTGFDPGAEDRDAIRQLVKLLDGLPLAIELAAARVRVMSPRALLSRMGDRFRLLASMGARQDRQATLRAAFDWSWELLNDAERTALSQLSVFEGGFSLGAAEHVLDLSKTADTAWPLDMVHSLVDKSFVRRLDSGRFDLLGSVQDYAAEQLRSEGRFPGSGAEGQWRAVQRHAVYFANCDAPPNADARADLENFIAACQRCLSRADAALVANLLERAWSGYRQLGPYSAAAELALRVLSIDGIDRAAKARVHAVAGNALHYAGRNAEAQQHLNEAVALHGDCGDRVGQARALRMLADLDSYFGRSEQAQRHAAQALATARELGDGETEVYALTTLGNLAQKMGRNDEARLYFEQAIECAEVLGSRRYAGAAHGILALLCGEQGQTREALAHHHAALAAAMDSGNRALQADTLCNLGLLHQLMGDPAAARTCLQQSLDIVRTTGDAHVEGVVLCNLGIVCESLAQVDAARQFYEQALAVARELGDHYMEGQFLGCLGLLHARQSRHDEARRSLDAAQAMLEAATDRIGLAVVMCGRAEAAVLAGAHEEADTAFDAANRLAAAVGAGHESELGLALQRLRSSFGLGLAAPPGGAT
jgi:predicted ATPase/class 3 adenylate cyclase